MSLKIIIFQMYRAKPLGYKEL